MFENILKQDLQRIGKTKKFKAKRPIEYWIIFLKKNVLKRSKSSFKFNPQQLLFFIPVVIIVIMFLKGVDGEDIFPILFFYPFYYIFLFFILNKYKKYEFVPVDAFQDLAKFIIAIKGDVHKNLINLRIDYSPIEHENNLLDPTKIGLVTRKGTSYKPYKLERYNAQFTMKDGTVCTTSLNQISIKVKTTKRRSSGKIKTKYKHKHKFFYALTLKLNPANYDIINAHEAIKLSNNKYQVAVTTINNAHFVKLKYKSKPSAIASVLRPQLKHSKSAVTEMLTYLTNNKVMIQQQLK